MTVYQVWDHDPMDGSMGRDYCDVTFRSKAKAEAERDRRNAEWKAYFIKTAQDGARRADAEPWNWQFAYVKSAILK